MNMTHEVAVPAAARAAFAATLSRSSDHAGALPDPLPMGRVLWVVDGNIDSEESLQVLAGRDERGWFLDYYRVDQDKDGETSRHGRVRESGELEALENYEGQYGRETFPDDPVKTEAELQRILAHNTCVKVLLGAKGFIRLAKADLTTNPLIWKHTGDAELPYTTEFRGRRCTIRINDFPAEPLYTLIVDGDEQSDLEDWPAAWTMPAPPRELLELLKPKPIVVHPRADGRGTQLTRLARLLEERGGPMLPLLRAVEIAREPSFFMDVSALSRRFTILLPARAEVLAALAPDSSLGDLPLRPLLKVFCDGERLHVAVVSVGEVAPSVAVDVAPEPARATWRETILAMHAFGNGRISSRLRFLDRARATIDVLYDARTPADDEDFVASLDQIARRVGVLPAQRERAKSVLSSRSGAAVVVTTACTESGPAPELAFMFGDTDWDLAVRLCRLVGSEDAARGGAAMLGTIAGLLEAATTSGMQLLLRPEGPDVSVLVRLS